jgi:hypothetical protein
MDSTVGNIYLQLYSPKAHDTNSVQGDRVYVLFERNKGEKRPSQARPSEWAGLNRERAFPISSSHTYIHAYIHTYIHIYGHKVYSWKRAEKHTT